MSRVSHSCPVFCVPILNKAFFPFSFRSPSFHKGNTKYRGLVLHARYICLPCKKMTLSWEVSDILEGEKSKPYIPHTEAHSDLGTNTASFLPWKSSVGVQGETCIYSKNKRSVTQTWIDKLELKGNQLHRDKARLLCTDTHTIFLPVPPLNTQSGEPRGKW